MWVLITFLLSYMGFIKMLQSRKCRPAEHYIARAILSTYDSFFALGRCSLLSMFSLWKVMSKQAITAWQMITAEIVNSVPPRFDDSCVTNRNWQPTVVSGSNNHYHFSMLRRRPVLDNVIIKCPSPINKREERSKVMCELWNGETLSTSIPSVLIT